jgi:protein-S-isoprenylcysteine O-methyltransferase Ste14
MRVAIETVGWLACCIYSTVPAYWLMIHPFAERWRAQRRSPYWVLLPAWLAMWAAGILITAPWRRVALYHLSWPWLIATLLFAGGFYLYLQSSRSFSGAQLKGFPEVHGSNREQHLVTGGIRARVRHPIYLGHVFEMLAWSIGTGLVVCWALTVLAVITGAAMMRLEDAELEKRFGDAYRSYRREVPAVFPRL